MSQQTQTDSARRAPHGGGRTRAAKRWLPGAAGAAIIMLAPVLATGSAQASPSGSSTGDARQAAAVRGIHVFDGEHFTGPNTWLNGDVGRCYYVGSGWNDAINSARTESSRVVELWDNANCTGGAIVVDRTGYGEIGNWVSAYRIR